MNELKLLQREIVSCNLCQRLREHCQTVAREKRRAYLDRDYWGKPVPSFGDPKARLLIIGLAPGAHGANRTGRMFTGDKSGDWLFRAMHETGFASQASSIERADGLTLRDAYICASVRCAPPGNKPSPAEVLTCRPYLERELGLLPNVKAVMVLGRLAFDGYLTILKSRGRIESRAGVQFGHGVVHGFDPPLICSYHPSQQNTSTGKLTAPMLREVFELARSVIEPSPGEKSWTRQ